MSPRVTIPEVVARFAAYYERPGNAAWGSLHIILEDDNVRDADCEHCIKYATEKGDTEGAELAAILLSMSRTQRLKLPAAVARYFMLEGLGADRGRARVSRSKPIARHRGGQPSAHDGVDAVMVDVMLAQRASDADGQIERCACGAWGVVCDACQRAACASCPPLCPHAGGETDSEIGVDDGAQAGLLRVALGHVREGLELVPALDRAVSSGGRSGYAGRFSMADISAARKLVDEVRGKVVFPGERIARADAVSALQRAIAMARSTGS